jgi:hypothetical protein
VNYALESCALDYIFDHREMCWHNGCCLKRQKYFPKPSIEVVESNPPEIKIRCTCGKRYTDAEKHVLGVYLLYVAENKKT